MRESGAELFIADEEGERRVAARLFRSAGGGYSFTAAGADYTVHRGAALRVACRGELSYELEFDLLRTTSAEIETPFGTLSAELCTHSLSFSENGGFEAEYTLVFAGRPSRRKIAFRPKEGAHDEK